MPAKTLHAEVIKSCDSSCYFTVPNPNRYTKGKQNQSIQAAFVMFNEWHIKHSGRYYHTRNELGFFFNSSKMHSWKEVVRFITRVLGVMKLRVEDKPFNKWGMTRLWINKSQQNHSSIILSELGRRMARFSEVDAELQNWDWLNTEKITKDSTTRRIKKFWLGSKKPSS